jgi:hypothetical protein
MALMTDTFVGGMTAACFLAQPDSKSISKTVTPTMHFVVVDVPIKVCDILILFQNFKHAVQSQFISFKAVHSYLNS